MTIESSSSKDLLNEILNAQRNSTSTEAPAEIRYVEHKTKGSTAAQKFLDREPAEEGEVLPQEETAIPEQKSKPRKTNNLKGDEVVSVSSDQPLEVKPLLEKTPKELSLHRNDTHTRVMHKVADKGAFVTGGIDGLLETVGHGISEWTETVVFSATKTVIGVKHGMERGKLVGEHKE
jgi:hypothetical protein